MTSDHSEQDEAERSVLAERLNELFDTITDGFDRKGRPKRFSNPYVAKAISEDPTHGTSLNKNYLDGLRNGRHTNPSGAVLRALVKFFNDHRRPDQAPVTVGYLLGTEDKNDCELYAALQKSGVTDFALRVGNMDEYLRDQVFKMLDVLDRGSARTDSEE